MKSNLQLYSKSYLKKKYKARFTSELFDTLIDKISEDLIAFSNDVKLRPQPPEIHERHILDEPDADLYGCSKYHSYRQR